MHPCIRSFEENQFHSIQTWNDWQFGTHFPYGNPTETLTETLRIPLRKPYGNPYGNPTETPRKPGRNPTAALRKADGEPMDTIREPYRSPMTILRNIPLVRERRSELLLLLSAVNLCLDGILLQHTLEERL